MREAERDEGRGVVDQALALERNQDPAREVQWANGPNREENFAFEDLRGDVRSGAVLRQGFT
jgi:hypothetical protein